MRTQCLNFQCSDSVGKATGKATRVEKSLSSNPQRKGRSSFTEQLRKNVRKQNPNVVHNISTMPTHYNVIKKLLAQQPFDQNVNPTNNVTAKKYNTELAAKFLLNSTFLC